MYDQTSYTEKGRLKYDVSIHYLKFMTSHTGQQIIKICILPNISRSKGSQKMKFGQLIEYNKKNIFFEKSHTKCGWETNLRPFYKKSKLSLSLDQQPEGL